MIKEKNLFFNNKNNYSNGHIGTASSSINSTSSPSSTTSSTTSTSTLVQIDGDESHNRLANGHLSIYQSLIKSSSIIGNQSSSPVLIVESVPVKKSSKKDPLRSILKNGGTGFNSKIDDDNSDGKLRGINSDRSQPKFGILKKKSIIKNGSILNDQKQSSSSSVLVKQNSIDQPEAIKSNRRLSNPFQFFQKTTISSQTENFCANDDCPKSPPSPPVPPVRVKVDSASSSSRTTVTTTDGASINNVDTPPSTASGSGPSYLSSKTEKLPPAPLLQLSVSRLHKNSINPTGGGNGTREESISIPGKETQVQPVAVPQPPPPAQPTSQSRPKVTGWGRFSLPRASATSGQSNQSSSVAGLPSTTIVSGCTGGGITTPSGIHPMYTANATNARMSDLRRILNPEVEKEDSFKKFTEAIENCDCFEFNLNNAAKMITIVVLLATLILVIKALKGDR